MENCILPHLRLSDFVGVSVERLPLPAMAVIVTAVGALSRDP